MLDRLKIMLLPMLTLLFPLMKIAPPAYRWRIRSKIYRCYKVLHDLEPDAINATAIRAAIADGATPAALHPDVATYIDQHALYR